MYNSDEAINTYLHHCIEKFEAITDLQRIADVMHSFVQGYGVQCYNTDCYLLSNFRGNFTVQWYHHQKSDCAVFTLLYNMSETMLDRSVKVKEFNKVSGIYPRILWSKEMYSIIHAIATKL